MLENSIDENSGLREIGLFQQRIGVVGKFAVDVGKFVSARKFSRHSFVQIKFQSTI